jgi:hypothetical protein
MTATPLAMFRTLRRFLVIMSSIQALSGGMLEGKFVISS